jgi:hypothetical protein
MRPAGTFLPLAVLLTLAACAEAPPAPPPAATATAGTPAASPPPRAPAGPATEFDGRYAGTLELNPDRTRACPPAPAEEREITVQDGHATFLLNPRVRQTQTGTVGRNGSVRMAGMIDRTIATSGVFTGTGFLGEYRNGLCSYAVNMTKRSG